MVIITKGLPNYITLNLSNEVELTYLTLSIESSEYNHTFSLDMPTEINARSVTFEVTEGVDFTLPNNGDYYFRIINSDTLLDVEGKVVYRGIMRLKQEQETVTSYNSQDTTKIYE